MSETNFSPREIVSELDRHIVGQADAKRAVAVALRNRWRRQQLSPELRREVSPKNILTGPRGPVLLDAECAWYGDPAFDLSFCLSHLLLKCVWRPQWRARFLACFDALASTYLGGVTWEVRSALEARSAHLLPGLLLGRVDGKSPVEYITSAEDRDRVRRVARTLLLDPVDELSGVRSAWERT